MTLKHQTLALAVGAAKDHAGALLHQFEREGDSRTGKSSAVYLALVVLHKRLLTRDPAPPPVEYFVPDLERLVRGCARQLPPVQPLIEAALHVARTSGGDAEIPPPEHTRNDTQARAR